MNPPQPAGDVSAGRFVAPKGRDASATIRGFVYQVDLTIQRWLALQEGQALELECGEDIDLVSQALLGDDAQSVERLLEQVKHRLSALTLRTPAAVGALTWAVEHRRANPGLPLLFRYTTNATVGVEVDSPLPKGMGAIVAWTRLRQAPAAEDGATLLAGIRALLQTVAQPADINDTVWAGFQEFIHEADDTSFLDLVRAFEWSPHAPATDELGPQIQEELLRRGYAPSADHARVLYDQLFVYVFKVLTETGRKQLTSEALAEQLAQPTLSEADRLMLARLTRQLEELEPRLRSLEGATAGLNARVQQLARRYEIGASIDYAVTTPTLASPPAVLHLSERTRTVAEIHTALKSHVWTAIYGGMGIGKTQMGRLVAQTAGTLRAWVSFQDFTVAQACARLDTVVRDLAGVPLSGDYNTWYKLLPERLGQDALLILDDLPRLNGRDDLSTRLIYLTQACEAVGIRILTLSAYPLPSHLRALFPADVLDEQAIPPFSDQEILDILSAYNAPEAVRNPRFVQTLAGLTRRHPLLLAAIARYLAARAWQFTDETLHGLLGNAYTAELNPETMHRLLESTTSSQSRELLYRLSLSLRPLAQEDWLAVAQVRPAITRPSEHLATLIGLWIQRDAESRLLASPLIQPLGATELAPATQKHCHRVLADRIVHRGTMDVPDVIEALGHCMGATEFDRAGTLLILALNAFNDLDDPVPDLGLLELWAGTPLPEGMDLNLRLYVRSLQIAVRHKRGLPVDYLLGDVDALLTQATKKNAWAVLPLVIHAAVDTAHANRYLLVLLRLCPDARLPDGTPLVFPALLPPEGFIWVNGYTIKTANDLRDWLQMVTQLPPQGRQRAFNGALAEAGCLIVADRLWMLESDKPVDRQSWSQVLNELKGRAIQARQLGIELLWASFIRAEIVVRAEYEHDLPAAIVVGTSALQEVSGDPRIRFLISECIGRQFVYAKQDKEALQWLQQAIDQETTAYPHLHMLTLLNLSRAHGSTDPQTAIQYAQQGVDLALTGHLFPEADWAVMEEESAFSSNEANFTDDREVSQSDIIEQERVKALGELAIAQWLAGDLAAAFHALEQAGERLLSSRTSTHQWQDLFVVYGHVSGYLTTLATSGQPPSETGDGVPYVVPKRGIFLTMHPDRFRQYNPAHDAFVPAQLALFAEATGHDEQAARWAAWGIAVARKTSQPDVIAVLGGLCVVDLTLEDQYNEAIDLALEAGRLFLAEAHALQVIGVTTAPPDGANIAVDPHSREGRHQAEELAASMALLPIAFRLALVTLDAPERAQAGARVVAGRCRQIASGASDPELWTASADLLEQSFIEPVPAVELIRHSNSAATDRHRVAQLIGYLGASLQADALPVVAVRGQAVVLTDRQLQRLPAANRRLALPFITAYWMRVLLRVPFRFRRADLLGDELRRLQQGPIAHRTQRILEAVAYNLGVRLPIS